MSKKNHIMYWSPSLVKIATNDAVLNSASSLKKYSEDYECTLLNFFGEFNSNKNKKERDGINFLNYFGDYFCKILPRHGKLKSRISFILMILLSFFPLKNVIKKIKPDFLIIHLLTSLPLFLLIIFKFETKFILRISGLPKLNFFRKKLWQLAFKNIYCVTCPSVSTQNYLKSLDIIDNNKIKLLFDPIIEVSNFSKNKFKKDEVNFPQSFKNINYYLSIGRLTKQKNFLFLCECFKDILKKYPNDKLLIAGEGEDRIRLEKFIKHNNLQKNILLTGYRKDILKFLENSKGFILSSLWEDPGFVLIEAAMAKKFVLSSNCSNGPKDIITHNYNGILFNSNDKNDFLDKFEKFKKLKRDKNKDMLLNNLKVAGDYTIYKHYKTLTKIFLEK